MEGGREREGERGGREGGRERGRGGGSMVCDLLLEARVSLAPEAMSVGRRSEIGLALQMFPPTA